RLIAAFPTDEQNTVRLRLSDALHGVISQRLLPRAEGQGRAVAAEVMLRTGTIEDCIRDPDRTTEIRDHIAAGRENYGMQTFDQHLAELVRSGTVSFEVARAAASNPGDFDLHARLAAPSSADADLSGIMMGSSY
ncbi:MAG TPA: hypothetical protein VGB66_15225, partial [Longimicrobium sp.]